MTIIAIPYKYRIIRKSCYKVKNNNNYQDDTVQNFKPFYRTCVGVSKRILFITSITTRSLADELSEDYKAA